MLKFFRKYNGKINILEYYYNGSNELIFKVKFPLMIQPIELTSDELLNNHKNMIENDDLLMIHELHIKLHQKLSKYQIKNICFETNKYSFIRLSDNNVLELTLDEVFLNNFLIENISNHLLKELTFQHLIKKISHNEISITEKVKLFLIKS